MTKAVVVISQRLVQSDCAAVPVSQPSVWSFATIRISLP
jgi:hypothetical protein